MRERLKKADKETIRRYFENLADGYRKQGAVVEVEDWSYGRLAIKIYWGVTGQPAWEHCERRDWLCAEWDKHDGAWRIYGPGAPVHTEADLRKHLLEWRKIWNLSADVRDAWAVFKRSKSKKRWVEYIGALSALLYRQKPDGWRISA